MPSKTARAAALAAGLLATTAFAFDASSSKNVAVYWGQGYSQIDLSTLCADPSVDIVNLAFVNQFPKNVGEFPATNFANACGEEMYQYADGTNSGLRSNCPSIGPGIKECQAAGKKVLLSVGGGWPTDYYLETSEIAEYFAEFLWGAFGPQTSEWVDAGKPRPFGDASVDGFDLDIESFVSPAPFDGYQYANYGAFVSHLKDVLFPTGPSTYYISGAPQCVIPDARLADAIATSAFDFVFVQFYNTPTCSSRAGINGLSAGSTDFTFDDWVAWLKSNSANPGVKMYLGLPAGTDGAPYDTDSYLTPIEANQLISYYGQKHSDIFGGVMLWEATVSYRNQICEKGYSTWIKDILSGKEISEACASSTSSVASSTSASSTSSAPTVSPTATSPDGSCGGETGYTCIGYHLGECCSQWGYCGGDSDYCGTGCNPLFGKCDGSSTTSSVASSTSASTTSSAPTASSTATSPDGSCGGETGYTCIGYHMGECCSQWGFCGGDSDYCGTGCNPLFGKCDSSSTTSSSASSTTASAASSSSSVSSALSSSSVSTSYSASASSSSSVASSSSLSSTVYPSGNATSSIPTSSATSSHLYPTGNATSSIPTSSATSSHLYPTGNATSSIPSTSATSSHVYPTGNSTIYPTGTSSSSYVYPSGNTSTPCTTSTSSSVVYPTGGSSAYPTTGAPYPTGGYHNSSTSCTESSTGYPVYPSSSLSSESTFVYPTGPSSKPCSTSKASSSGNPVYPTGPSTTAKPDYPVYSHSSGTKTIYTTTYVDICSTGYTTKETTITTTVYPEATPKSHDVPEGWYTTVTVCHVCAAKPTTVTLTLPVTKTVYAYPTKPAGEGYVPSPPESTPGAYYPAPSETPSCSGPGCPKPEEEYPEFGKPEKPETETETATSTVYQYVTLTKVPVPASETPAPYAPYTPVNSTHVYAPTGSTTGTGSVPYGTYTPIEFEGAASRFSFGMSAVAVIAAGLLAL
ncbi:glycoside hydrolase [Lojkania enalia]|uniref:chitinase n=1 Tax=Lojkania enalia TaxID=147567 RepID=A0A9P4TRY7_9PLEO|nr:glycoside hydrolase [Didymosphaeria enalia]